MQIPLADRIRPKKLSEFIGQEHLLGEGKPLRLAIETKQIFSMIFWGPPGCGKTTLAKVIAQTTKANFVHFSAVTLSIKQLRCIIKQAEERQRLYQQKTIVFIDEIHRFNKAQQDSLLPDIEKGTITFIGATTENPSFE